MKIGIVGLPNVGKSTLFNALTTAGAEAANYPFCTIDPNVGVVAVPDERLDALGEALRPAKLTPTTIEFLDIAGLVEGASRGEGLGNRFLAHIREVEAVAHVVRCFENPDVAHVHGEVDPLRDREVVEAELALADLTVVEQRHQRVEKQVRTGRKDLSVELEALEKLLPTLREGRPARAVDLAEAGRAAIRGYGLLTGKPVLYVANVGEDDLAAAAADPRSVPVVASLADAAAAGNARVVAVCAELEAELAELDWADRREFLDAMGLAESGLRRVVRAGYDLLDLVTFFTTVGEEVRAWTLRRGGTALEAAAKIHTDMAEGFVRAEVVGWYDFEEAGRSLQRARETGVARWEGREYPIADGDIVAIRFTE